MSERDTSGNIITTDVSISTVGERELVEDQFSGRSPLGLWADTWRRLRRNHLAVVGMCIIIVFLALGITQEFANLVGLNTGDPGTGYLAPYDPNAVNYELSPNGLGSAPSWSHPFGTDYLGRDVFSRTLVATRISMLVGVIAVAIALFLGLILGPVSGYYGGWVDSVIMRTADVFFAFPYILFVLLIMTVLGPGLWNVFIAIGILGWATYARLNRGSVLSVKAMEYVEAARAQGASDLRIIFRHVLPNTMAPIYVAIAMGIGGAIVTEAALSYLGIGIQPPDASWGKMISDYLTYLQAGSWWMVTFPSVALTVSVFGFISFGNGLRDATDPKLKE
ncbi:MAG TPA: ABC transporter permease [Thermoleophilia bacterium]|nr:ABC transporter permease [Thermoleophilia bacterium]